MLVLRNRTVELATALACSAALLTGCTPAPGPTSAGSASSEAPADTSSSQPAAAVTLDITIHGGQVSPNGKKINLRRGQTLLLQVTSDADEEVHAHTAGDGYELEVHRGVPARGQFVAADTGTFEVELHHLNKVVAILIVR